MVRFKEQSLVAHYDDHGGKHNNDGFDTFCLRRHGDLFLHKVNEQMEEHARQDGPVADEVNPRDDESERDSAYKEVDHIPN